MYRVSALTAVTVLSVTHLTSCGGKNQAEENEANLNLAGYELNQTGLFKAIENDDLQALKFFKANKFDFNQTDLDGRSTVYAAAESGSVRALNFILNNGADINARGEGEVSALMIASKLGRVEVIKYLLEKGVDPVAKDKVGKFALIHAMDGGSAAAIELLAPETRKSLDTGLLYAANLNKHEAIPVLVRYGASVYARNSGKTSLMIAAERGNAEAVEALLAEDSNLYAVSDDGRLAKDYAEGNESVMALLVGSEEDLGEDVFALEWSEDELEKLVQKAMERSAIPSEVVSRDKGVDSVSVTKPINGVEPDDSKPAVEPKKEVVLKRIQGQNIALELSGGSVVNEKVTMAAYAEKSLPIKVEAGSGGQVEVFDLRDAETLPMGNSKVVEGSKIAMTGLRVKQIKKKIVNNKLTGGQDQELVTLMIEDERTGKQREFYAGYESQAAEAVAVLRMNDTGELLIVERGDEFYDLKGVGFKVADVNDEEVIIENKDTGALSLLPLMGVKK